MCPNDMSENLLSSVQSCKSKCVRTSDTSPESDVKTGMPKTTLSGAPAKPEARVGPLASLQKNKKRLFQKYTFYLKFEN